MLTDALLSFIFIKIINQSTLSGFTFSPDPDLYFFLNDCNIEMKEVIYI